MRRRYSDAERALLIDRDGILRHEARRLLQAFPLCDAYSSGTELIAQSDGLLVHPLGLHQTPRVL
jgi:hypothetical protein